METVSYCALDLETWGHLDLSVHPAPPIVCCSYQIDGETPQLVKGAHEAVIAMCRLMKDPAMHCGGVNFMFDLGCLCAAEPALVTKVFKWLEEGRLHDCSLLERLHDIGRGCLDFDPQTGERFNYSLAQLEKRYFGRDRSAEKEDGWRLRYAELDDVPLLKWPQAARQYPLDDASGTLDVLKIQLSGKDRLNVQCEPFDMQFLWAAKLQSLWGVRTDPATVAEVVGDIEKEHKASREKFLEAGFVEKRKPRGGKNPETPDGFEADGTPFMYVSKKAPIQARVTEIYNGNPPLTDKGGVSTDRETLMESGDELLEAWGKSGVNEKEWSTYCSVLELGTAAPIHYSYNAPLNSGRCSMRNPNLQNLSR